MLPLIIRLCDIFGCVPWLERYLGVAFNKKLFSHLGDIATRIAGTDSVQSALDRIKNTPELKVEFQKALLLAEESYMKASLLDRQHARERDMALFKAKGTNRRANVMVVLAALGLASCLLVLSFFKEALSGEVVGIVSTVAGIFGSCLKDAYAFEFGNFKGRSESSPSVASIE